MLHFGDDRLKEKLAEMGMAGVLAYGILNTAYYIFAFLFFFIAVAKVPRGQRRAPELLPCCLGFPAHHPAAPDAHNALAVTLRHGLAGLGYTEVVRKIAESMALTWAGSQVTKIPWAAG